MQHQNKTKPINGFTIIELIMVMIIIGVLAAVAIPRFQDIVIESEIAVEQRIINTIYNGLETFAREKYVSNGVRSWPDNPFDALSKLPPDYDDDLFVLSSMKDRDWVFTGTGNNSTYNLTIGIRNQFITYRYISINLCDNNWIRNTRRNYRITVYLC